MKPKEIKRMAESTSDAAFAVDGEGLIVAWNREKHQSGHLDRANLLINSRRAAFRCDGPDVETATPRAFRLRANAALNRSSVRSMLGTPYYS
ncbi:MAG TPA: hypothetical protein DHU55_06090 [Blastocatellia bacterium]|nr:hypothetical protein [Blastocatellia bacterium]